MGDVLGEILPNAVAVAVSPIPIVAVILMLFTPRARVDSLSQFLTWLAEPRYTCLVGSW